MSELREHDGRTFAVQLHYSVPDASWCVELSEAEPAPASWEQISGAASHVPGPALVVAMVPDEDLSVEPTVWFARGEEHGIPYEMMCWFMENAAQEVERCRSRRSDAS